MQGVTEDIAATGDDSAAISPSTASAKIMTLQWVFPNEDFDELPFWHKSFFTRTMNFWLDKRISS
jgi:hypothetical protein